jgi:hypothetical protein
VTLILALLPTVNTPFFQTQASLPPLIHVLVDMSKVPVKPSEAIVGGENAGRSPSVITSTSNKLITLLHVFILIIPPYHFSSHPTSGFLLT